MKPARVTVKVRQSGTVKPLVARIGKVNSAKLKVGIFGGAAAQVHHADINAEGDVADGTLLTTVMVASFHEFGTPTLPQRSFIRATCDEQKPKVIELQRRIGKGIVVGKLDEKQGLKIIGEHMRSAIQARIRGGITPALSPQTIKRKKSSTPLINSGQLIGSIAYEVVPVRPRIKTGGGK